MLTDSFTGNPRIAELIRAINSEQKSFDRNLRSVPREKLVLPVALRLNNCTTYVHGFTRNLSPNGMCVISDRPFRQDSHCRVVIHRLDSENENELLAQCRWCKPFGVGYWVTGWQFLTVDRV